MLSYFPCLHQEVQQCDEFGCSLKATDSTGISISGYRIWGEGDLFKAPEPIIEETVMGVDPVTAAMSMISCGEAVIPPQSLNVADIESSIKSGEILSEVFYECRKDLLAKEGNETPLSEVLCIKLPDDKMEEQNMINGEKLSAEGSFLKSVSSSCLRSMDNVNQSSVRPKFLDFQEMDFGAATGMRRAFSEGDIKTLGNNTNCLHLQLGQQSHTLNMVTITSEERREKLSRYRIKKSRRNFGRKIKYACRKAIADSQPRIRGRFAKTEEMGSLIKQ